MNEPRHNEPRHNEPRHNEPRHSVEAICGAHGISRQAYYQGRERHQVRGVRQEEALKVVRAERRVLPRLGTRKLYASRRLWHP